MKSIITVAAVCVMAATANAAAFKWSASNVRIPVATNPKVSQTGIKVTSDSTAFTSGDLMLNLFYVDSKGVEKSITSKANDNGAGLKSYEVFTHESAIYSTIMADQPEGVIDFVMRAQYVTADGTYDFYQTVNKDISGLKDTNASVIFNMGNGSWNYTANPIPEPTSGLLLLLGVAGLALRRRRA